MCSYCIILVSMLLASHSPWFLAELKNPLCFPQRDIKLNWAWLNSLLETSQNNFNSLTSEEALLVINFAPLYTIVIVHTGRGVNCAMSHKPETLFNSKWLPCLKENWAIMCNCHYTASVYAIILLHDTVWDLACISLTLFKLCNSDPNVRFVLELMVALWAWQDRSRR